MMNANVLEGLKLISKGIEEILSASQQIEESTASAEVAETKKTTRKTAKKSTKKAEEVDTPDTAEEFSEEDLNSMSYNELKKLAKDLGVSATGSRKELVEKLISLSEGEDTEDDDEEEETPAPKKSTKPTKSTKSKKVEEPEDDEDDEEDEDSEDNEDDEEEDLASQVTSALEDMSDDELKSILEEVDIPAKGKRQALITKIIHAVEDGLIELDLGDDEDEPEDEDTDTEEPEDEESEDVTANMTKKRKKAYDSICEETSDSFESGDLERADLIDFINEFNGTNDKMKKVSDEDLLEAYLKIAALFIDDDGNEIEEGAYYINGTAYCCGRPLKYDKKKKQYVCESCGSAYDEE